MPTRTNLLGTGALEPGVEAALVQRGAIHVWQVSRPGKPSVLGVTYAPLREAATHIARTARESLTGSQLRMSA